MAHTVVPQRPATRATMAVHAAATGYVYFVGDYGMKDKYYLTIDHAWVP